MAKTSTRRLQVFQSQFGFYDTVVAAASRAAALRAWGTHQDLFASGQAGITEDPAAIDAALAHPGTPLKRAVGSKDPFALEAARLPDVPDPPQTPRIKPVPKPSSKKPAPPKGDPKPLRSAERALRRLDETRRREETELRRLRDELDDRIAAAQAGYVQARKAATRAVDQARQAYRKADGED